MTRPVRHAMHSTCSQRLAVYRSAALKHFRCKGHCVAMPMMIQLLLCCRCCSGRSGHGLRSATLSAPAVTCTPLCLLAMLAMPDMQLWQPKAVHSTVSPLATVGVLQQCVPPALPPLATGAVMKLVASRPLVAAAASITKVRYAFCVSHEGTINTFRACWMSAERTQPCKADKWADIVSLPYAASHGGSGVSSKQPSGTGSFVQASSTRCAST